MVFENINFAEMLRSLEAMGFYDVIFPFLLVFTILYAVLQKINLFGTGPQVKNINIVISFVIGFFVLRVPAIVETINQFLPRVSLLVIILLMFLLILGIFGTDPAGFKGVPFFLGLGFALIGVIWAVYASVPGTSSWLPTWLYLTPSDKGILLAVGIFFLILLMFREKKDEKQTVLQWMNRELKPEQWGRKGGSS